MQVDSKIIRTHLLADSVIWIHKILPENKERVSCWQQYEKNKRSERSTSKIKLNLTSQLNMLGYPAMDLDRSATSNETHHDHKKQVIINTKIQHYYPFSPA